MQAPKLPSFFKTPNHKSFSFKARYYDEHKERRKQLKTGKKARIKFNIGNNNARRKERSARIILLIIILSLLAYKFIIN